MNNAKMTNRTSILFTSLERTEEISMDMKRCSEFYQGYLNCSFTLVTTP